MKKIFQRVHFWCGALALICVLTHIIVLPSQVDMINQQSPDVSAMSREKIALPATAAAKPTEQPGTLSHLGERFKKRIEPFKQKVQTTIAGQEKKIKELQKKFDQEKRALEESLRREKDRVSDLQEQASRLQKKLEEEREQNHERAKTYESQYMPESQDQHSYSQEQSSVAPIAEYRGEYGEQRYQPSSTTRARRRGDRAAVQSREQVSLGAPGVQGPDEKRPEQEALHKQKQEIVDRKKELETYRTQLEQQVAQSKTMQQQKIAQLEQELAVARAGAQTVQTGVAMRGEEERDRITALERKLDALREEQRDTAGTEKVLQRQLQRAEQQLQEKSNRIKEHERTLEAARGAQERLRPLSLSAFMREYNASALAATFAYILAPQQRNEVQWHTQFINQMAQLGISKKPVHTPGPVPSHTHPELVERQGRGEPSLAPDIATYAMLVVSAAQSAIVFYGDATLGTYRMMRERLSAVASDATSMPPFELSQFPITIFIAWLEFTNSPYASKVRADYAKILRMPDAHIDEKTIVALKHWFASASSQKGI